MTEQDAYNELCAYTLMRGDATFIHQHVVDTYAAQNANETTKPIGITFSLAGLYLHVERNFTGKEVQRAHMKMGREKRTWPEFTLPQNRGAIRVTDVLAAPAGDARDQAIHDWCASVWNAFSMNRNTIVSLLRQYAI